MIAYSSPVLRHKSSAADITLDAHGWADVDELLSAVRRTGRRIDMDTLFIVQWDQMAKLKYQLTSHDITGKNGNARRSYSHFVSDKQAAQFADTLEAVLK